MSDERGLDLNGCLRELQCYPTYPDTEEGHNLDEYLGDLGEAARAELEETARRMLAAEHELSKNPRCPFTKMEQEILDELLHKLQCRLNL